MPTGPESLPVAISSTASTSRRRPRSTSNAQPASLRPSVVGSAWTEWVRPIISVPASARARGDEHLEEPVRVVEEQVARRPELEREGRVDDVAARQPEVEVPALRPDRLGDLRDERDDVVVGRPLDLVDPVDVDPRPVPRSRRGRRRHATATRPGPARRRARPGASARSGPRPSRSRPSRAACSAGSSGGSHGHAGRGGSRSRDVAATLHAVPA